MNRKEFFEKINDTVTKEEKDLIEDAYWIAKEAHRLQKRDDGERYFEHCRRVALILIEHGPININEIVAALLHDCVEDCFFPAHFLERHFGPNIANAVDMLSKVTPTFDEETGAVKEKIKKGNAEYYRKIAESPTWIRRIKLADRLDNISDMSVWLKERKQKYLYETERYVLPIAVATDNNLHTALLERCNHSEEPVEYAAQCISGKKCRTFGENRKIIATYRVWPKHKFFEYIDCESKYEYAISTPIQNADMLIDELEKNNWIGILQILREINKEYSFAYFCAQCNGFYCDDCAVHEMDSDGFSLDFYTYCPHPKN